MYSTQHTARAVERSSLGFHNQEKLIVGHGVEVGQEDWRTKHNAKKTTVTRRKAVNEYD